MDRGLSSEGSVSGVEKMEDCGEERVGKPETADEPRYVKRQDGDGGNTQPMEQTYHAVFSPLMHDPAACQWPVGGCSVDLTPGREASMYPRSPVVDYPSPALSNASLSYGAHSQAFMSDCHFAQLEPSIGPARGHGVTTRRQTFSQKVLGRPTPLPRLNGVAYSGTRRMMATNEQPTPLRHAPPSLTIPIPSQPPPVYDPMTPSSTPEPYAFDSSRAPPPDPPRSPALSAASDFTSYQPTKSQPAPKPRGKKRHLEDHDRKAICLYHQEHPQERQEDIGKEFDVERSTISKILKQRAKWLNIPDTPGVRVSKHRPSKFPEVEEELRKWVEECTVRKMAISDNSIREKAKEVANELGIAPEKFKASSGWVENFKSRTNIRGGMWHGYKSTTARIIDISSPDAPVSTSPIPGSLSPMNPAFMTDRAALEAMAPRRVTDMDIGASPVTDHQHAASTPDAVSWSGADVTPSQPSPLSAQSHLEQMSAVVPYSHLQPHHLVAPDTTSSHPDTQFIPPEQYGPRRVITAAEAEEHFDALLRFIDTQHEDFISTQARRVLHTVKLALFKESHGI